MLEESEWDSWRRSLIWASKNGQTSLKPNKKHSSQGNNTNEGRELGIRTEEETTGPRLEMGMKRTRKQDRG